MSTLATGSPAPLTLSPLVRRLFFGISLSALGNGLVMPFLYVYLTEVRHLTPTFVGLVLAWMGLLSLGLTGPVGTLIDRWGPRPVLMLGLVVEAVGVVSWSMVTTIGEAFAVGSLIAAGGVALWPAGNALLTRMVDVSQRERAFGVQFMLMNAGLGVGGLISSVLVSIDDVGSFQRLYQFNAVSYVAYLVVLATLPRLTGALVKEETEGEPAPQGGWREVFRDRTLLRVVAITVLMLTFGYAQIEAGFTAFSVTVAGIEPHYLGWAFAANTGAIVAGQMITLRLIKGRARSRLMAVTAAIWAAAWIVIGLGGVVSGWWAVAMVVIGLGVFGVGETIWAPVAPAIINALATEELRGRYNAIGVMSWSISGIIGPALAGILFGSGLAGLWLGLTIGGTALSAVLLLGLGKHLTAEQNGLVTD